MPQKPNLFYLISVSGIIPLTISVLLPWISVGYLTAELSLNGLGNWSGPSILVSQANAQPSGNIADGVWLLAIAGTAVVVAALGLFLDNNTFGLLLTGTGIGALALAFNDINNASDKVKTFNDQSAGQPVAAQLGIGLYIAAGSAFLLIVSGLVPVIIKNYLKK